MELKIEYVKPSTLNEYKNNAREHHDTDVNAIAASIKEFGLFWICLADLVAQ